MMLDAQYHYSLGNTNWNYQLHCIARRMAKVKSVDHTNVGTKVEKLELLNISGGNVKQCNYFENSSHLLKGKQTPTILFRIPLQVLTQKNICLWTNPCPQKKNKKLVHDSCSCLFISQIQMTQVAINV